MVDIADPSSSKLGQFYVMDSVPSVNTDSCYFCRWMKGVLDMFIGGNNVELDGSLSNSSAI
jgi:hypothetical protein